MRISKFFGRSSGIFLMLSLLFLAWMVGGCATKSKEVIRDCADYHLYDSKVELQFNSGQLSSINGFHRTTKDGYEVHTKKWDLCNAGHELYHGLVKEGMDPEGHPHFKWSEK